MTAVFEAWILCDVTFEVPTDMSNAREPIAMSEHIQPPGKSGPAVSTWLISRLKDPNALSFEGVNDAGDFVHRMGQQANDRYRSRVFSIEKSYVRGDLAYVEKDMIGVASENGPFLLFTVKGHGHFGKPAAQRSGPEGEKACVSGLDFDAKRDSMLGWPGHLSEEAECAIASGIPIPARVWLAFTQDVS
jgi:hypothetical protein